VTGRIGANREEEGEEGELLLLIISIVLMVAFAACFSLMIYYESKNKALREKAEAAKPNPQGSKKITTAS
jgi:flagellar basal body-associated protein FliL